jgi:hypothetical protein
MKISRFNEDISNLIDLEYITDCFIEFKDMDILEIDSNAQVTDVYITLDFSKLHPYRVDSVTISLEDVIARAKNKLDVAEELVVSLKKVAVKYKNMQYILTDDKKIIKIRLTLSTSELANNYPDYWTMINK